MQNDCIQKKTFKEWRKEKGITAEFAKEKLRMSRPTFDAKEKDPEKFGIKQALDYCDILGISIQQVKF